VILLALKKALIQSESKSPHCLKRYLLIYRYLASRIGLVQLQDKIVVRFAHTIYPYSLAFFYLFPSHSADIWRSFSL